MVGCHKLKKNYCIDVMSTEKVVKPTKKLLILFYFSKILYANFVLLIFR